MQDLTGKQFNELYVVSYAYKKGNKHYWNCKCSCGNDKICETHNLINGNNKTCGNGIHRIENLKGQKFNKLTVIQYAYTKNNKAYWKCLCDCGNTTIVRSDCLKDGNTQSCGCWNIECHKKDEHECVTKNKLYHVYYAILQRCYNNKDQNYKHYGERGIHMCDEWKNNYKSFEMWSLSNGYEEGLTIDRINVNGNYEPDNCRWVTQKVQCNNTRRNRKIEYKGEIHNITEWSNILSINRNTLNYRLNQNWDVEKAFTK